MATPWFRLVVATLSIFLLCSPSVVSGNCCFSGTCSRCRSMSSDSHFCAKSAEYCGSCGGTFCAPTSNEPAPTRTPEPAADDLCCFDARDRNNMCGTCHSGAKGTEWCARSQDQCTQCGGKWCPGKTGSPATTKPATTSTVDVRTTGQSSTTTRSTATTSTTRADTTRVPATERTTTSTTEQTTTRPRVTQPASTAMTSTRTTTTDVRTSTTETRTVVESGWIEGTYTTGYWDCCKPSCSWPNKGRVTAPVKACKADGSAAGPNDASVCDGGVAASCTDNQPWKASATRSYGFTAAAVSGSHGLTGDANCGQCYELQFTAEIHSDGNWGGSHPDLVGKSHIVQVTNIGYDVSGKHSFDLQIPGAGQGAFTSGCTKQFGGKPKGDFDCDNNYGGCDDISGCARLPKILQKGCEWRYTFYKWLVQNGKSNNPYVKFRRVRCPKVLTDISGSVPLDDDNHPAV